LTLLDLALLGIQAIVNQIKVLVGSPPPWEYSSGFVALLYALLVGTSITLYALLRRSVADRRSAWRWVLPAAIALLAARAVIVMMAYQAPIGRARTLQSIAHVREVAAAVDKYARENRRLPQDLDSLEASRALVRDGWGFKIAYSKDPDGLGYTVRAVGVPTRYRDLAIYGPRLEAHRRPLAVRAGRP
jgi:hypothetical protein